MFRRTAAKTEGPITASITDTAPCEKSLSLRVKPELIAPVRLEVIKEFQREAALDGFRKGKVPQEIVERRFAEGIQEETLRRVARQALEQVSKDHGLKPVGPFELAKAELADGEGLRLEAKVEVEPAFALASYKGVPLTRPSEEVGAADREEALTKLQESLAQLVPTGQGEAKERKVPARDDEFAKDLGFESLETLTRHVEAKLREQKRAVAAQTLEAALCEELLARHQFEVPAKLVAHQTERLSREFKVRLLLGGMPEEQVAQRLEGFAEQLRTNAHRHVKLGFILDRVAEQEQVAVSQDDIVKRLWQLSQRWKKDPKEVRRLFDEQGLWPSVVSAIRQEKTVALLLANAAIEPMPATTEGGKG
ncbi:MAG: hypothetical protein HY601_03530 [Candidatus Omnitrophica bacterium]|nr:hypothetical protein [Candidatus Omnitrophota bacterium]